MVWKDILSTTQLKRYVKPGAVFSVGFQHLHQVIARDENKFWWYCQTGDCGSYALEEVHFDECDTAFADPRNKDKLAYFGMKQIDWASLKEHLDFMEEVYNEAQKVFGQAFKDIVDRILEKKETK